MAIANREIATSSEASLVFGHFLGSIAISASKAALPAALVPVFGIRLDAAAFRRISERRLRGAPVLLRNPMLSTAKYNREAPICKDSFYNGAQRIPDDWEAWRSLLGRFDMVEPNPGKPIRYWVPPAKW